MKKNGKFLAVLLCFTMVLFGVLMGCKDDKDTPSGGDLDVVTSSEDGQWTGVHRP